MSKSYPFTVLLTFALCALAPAASAFDTFVSERLGVVPPYTGTYFDPEQSGSGLQVDIGPGLGNFISFQTYDAAGNQVNYLVQADYQPTTNQERTTTGIIGRASGEFYKALGGQCPGCAYTPPHIEWTGLHGTFEWSSPRHVTMTLDDAAHSTYHWQAMNFESHEDDAFLPGTWAANLYVDVKASNPGNTSADYQGAAMGLVKFSALPANTGFSRDPAAPASFFLPPSTARLYKMECLPDQTGQGTTNRIFCFTLFGLIGPMGSDAVAWYDPVTRRAGLENARLVDGVYVIGKKADSNSDAFSMHFDLYLGPDVLRGRGVFETATVRQNTRALTFVRMPDGTTRLNSGYY